MEHVIEYNGSHYECEWDFWDPENEEMVEFVSCKIVLEPDGEHTFIERVLDHKLLEILYYLCVDTAKDMYKESKNNDYVESDIE